MDLRSHSPYPLLRHGIVRSYPSLTYSSSTQTVVIGAGITGALVAWYLVNAGFDVVVLDKRHVAMGSTSASTALLQYEIDTPLYQLQKLVGERDAVQSYRLCREAIEELGDICRRLPKVPFHKKPSLQFASYNKHVKGLHKEFELRKSYGFDVEWLSDRDVETLYGFKKPAAILSGDGADVDAYLLTHALLSDGERRGLRVFDHTGVLRIKDDDQTEVLTEQGFTITAKNAVVACGYESGQFLKKPVEQLHSTYCIVSEPAARKEFWHRNSLIWETAIPYTYMRITDDQRILVGGMDDPFYNPDKRDAQLPKKAQTLQKKFTTLFDLPFKIDFKWAGTFGSTKDGLPYIGANGSSNIMFALGYGGNGITFSVIAAGIIRDLLSGKKNSNARIFKFDR